jgi:hypothetical protein
VPGDVVKLGRVEFRVIECKYHNKLVAVEEKLNNVNYSNKRKNYHYYI